MKKFLKAALVSALALVSFVGFSATNVKADIQLPSYLHTLNQSDLYSNNGNEQYSLIVNKKLPQNTDWMTNRFDPTTSMWRVGGNEWVENYNVAQVFANYRKVITNNTKNEIYRMDSNYRFSETGKILTPGNWMNDREVAIPSATGTSAPAVYYRVATNQWIRLNNQQTQQKLTFRLTSNQRVYNSAQNSYTRTLPNGSSWIFDKVIRNSKKEFWGRVSTNEWMLLDAKNMYMDYGVSDKIPNVAVDNSGFAVNINK